MEWYAREHRPTSRSWSRKSYLKVLKTLRRLRTVEKMPRAIPTGLNCVRSTNCCPTTQSQNPRNKVLVQSRQSGFATQIPTDRRLALRSTRSLAGKSARGRRVPEVNVTTNKPCWHTLLESVL